MSSTALCKCQKGIILTGLKLTCTPKSNSIQLTRDHKIFAYKLRLIEYLGHHNVAPVDQKDKSLVQGKLDFFPPRKRNKELERHISLLIT